jgi:hypothetical protein
MQEIRGVTWDRHAFVRLNNTPISNESLINHDFYFLYIRNEVY